MIPFRFLGLNCLCVIEMDPPVSHCQAQSKASLIPKDRVPTVCKWQVSRESEDRILTLPKKGSYESHNNFFVVIEQEPLSFGDNPSLVRLVL